MSNVYDFEDYLTEDYQNTLSHATLASEGNPDDGLRALQLSRSTGTPPQIVNSDLENADKSYKRNLTTALLQGNSALRDYVDSHPLAALVSNDDYGRLDAASQSITKFQQKGLIDDLWDVSKEMLWDPLVGVYKMGLGKSKIEDEQFQMMRKAVKDAYLKGGEIDIPGVGKITSEPASEDAAEAQAQRFETTWRRGNVIASLATLYGMGMYKLASAGFLALYGSGRQYVTRPLEEAGYLPKETTEGLALALGAAGGLGLHVAMRFHKAGKLPPNGVHEVLDEAQKLQSKVDAKALQEAERASDRTNTIDRDRDLYAQQFVDDAHGPPRPIGIATERIRELYPDLDEKIPKPDDGKLGFVEELRERVKQAEESGKGEIQISLGDWISRIKPEVRDFLREDVRARPGGLTRNEAKDMPEVQQVADEIDVMRKAAGLPTNEERLGLPPAEAPPEEPTGAEIFPPTGEVVTGEPPKIRRREKQFEAEKGKQLELDVTRMSEKEIFDKASRLGRTVDQFKRLMKWIKEDRQARGEAKAKSVAAQKVRESKAEWKENRANMRQGVERNIQNQPAVEADRALRQTQKLDKRYLDPEAAKELKEIVSDGEGIHPDDIAGVFGFGSGDEMVGALRALHQAKALTGMTMGKYLYRMTDVVTDRLMKEKYGDQAEEVLRDINDLAFSEGTLELFHEDTLRAAEEAGMQIPVDQKAIDASVNRALRAEALENLDSRTWVNRAGRAGQMVEQLLTKQMPAKAIKFMQVQYRALRGSKIVQAYERRRVAFDRITDRFSKRDVKISVQDSKGKTHSRTFPNEFLNIMHSAMDKVGIEISRSPQDLARELAAQPQGDIVSFTEALNKKTGLNIRPPDFLVDGAQHPLEKLSMDEFDALHSFLNNLAEAGRTDGVARFGNEVMVKETAMDLFKDQLARLGPVSMRDLSRAWDRTKEGFDTLTGGLLQLQSVFSRMDAGDPLGIFSRMFNRTSMLAGHNEILFKKEFGKMYEQLPKMKARYLRQQIANHPFINSYGIRIPFTRKTLLGLMMHFGNPSNFNKVVQGWLPKGMDANGFASQIKDFVARNATEKDWEWVQKAGDIFKEVAKREAKMERDMGFMPYHEVDLTPMQIEGRDGFSKTVDGWYAPLNKDHRFATEAPDLFERGNTQATTPPGYYNKRTGAKYPVDFNIDLLPMELTRRAKNLAYRPFVIEASKFFMDGEFQNLMQNHMGTPAKDLLVPYLERLTKPKHLENKTWQMVDTFFEGLRQNLVADLIGMAASTVVKHGLSAAVNSLGQVGPGPYARAVLRNKAQQMRLLAGDFDPNVNNSKFAMDNSTLLQSRVAAKRDNLMGQHDEVIGKPTFRARMMEAGSWAVSKIDLASAIPTWNAEYAAQVGKVGHQRAVYLADWAVQRAHGSTALTAKPEIMISSSATVRGMTSLYNFFSTMFNRQYEAAWRAKDAYKIAVNPQLMGQVDRSMAYTHARKAAMLLVTSVIAPAIIEEMASPIPTDEDESYWWWGSKMIASEFSSGIPIVRDIVHALIWHQDPTMGIIPVGGQRVKELMNDVAKVSEDGITEENAGKLVKDVISGIAITKGWTNETEANFVKGLIDVYNEQQSPEGIKEWTRLITKGDVAKHGPLDWLMPEWAGFEAQEPRRRR